MGKWSVPSYAALDTRRAVEHRLFGRSLSERERKILGWRIGWSGEVLTQQEVADRLGLSQPAVSQVENKLVRAMDRLRKTEQEALDALPQSKALATAVGHIEAALEGIQAVRSGAAA